MHVVAVCKTERRQECNYKEERDDQVGKVRQTDRTGTTGGCFCCCLQTGFRVLKGGREGARVHEGRGWCCTGRVGAEYKTHAARSAAVSLACGSISLKSGWFARVLPPQVPLLGRALLKRPVPPGMLWGRGRGGLEGVGWGGGSRIDYMMVRVLQAGVAVLSQAVA